MTLEVDLLRMAQALIFLLGGIVMFFALRGYSRRRSRAMLCLGLGFGIMSVGTAIAGTFFEVLGVDILTSMTVDAYFQALGFLVIVSSLRIRG